MRKIAVAAGLLVVAAAALIGGFVIFERSIENGIREALDARAEAGQDVRYGDVRVDLLGDVAEISALQARRGEGEQVTLGRMTIRGIRQVDRGGDVAAQIRDFDIDDVTLARTGENAATVTIGRVIGRGSNLLALLQTGRRRSGPSLAGIGGRAITV